MNLLIEQFILTSFTNLSIQKNYYEARLYEQSSTIAAFSTQTNINRETIEQLQSDEKDHKIKIKQLLSDERDHKNKIKELIIMNSNQEKRILNCEHLLNTFAHKDPTLIKKLNEEMNAMRNQMIDLNKEFINIKSNFMLKTSNDDKIDKIKQVAIFNNKKIKEFTIKYN